MLREILFENPLKPYVVLTVAEVTLAALWCTRRTRRTAAALVVPPVLAAAVGVTAHLVVTDRERIASALEVIGRSLESGDPGPVATCLDPTCLAVARSGRIIRRAELIALGRSAPQRYGVTRIRVGDIETRIDGDRAVTSLTTHVRMGRGTLAGSDFTAAWRLEWIKRGDGWRITRVEAVYPPVLAEWRF